MVKMKIIKRLLVIAANKDYELFEFEVNNTFLHGDLFGKVYMQTPLDFYNHDNKFCKLVKTLYGLK